jgi:L-iditol 2-dehydrogenase
MEMIKMNDRIMNFGVLTGVKKAEVKQRTLPKLRDNDVLVKLQTCNICTTDYGQWLGLRNHQPFPMAGGHENSGIIVEKGCKVRDDLNIGDRVGFSYYYCGECEDCRQGNTVDCKEFKIELSDDGYYGFFGFADYKIMDAKFAIKIDKDIPSAEAGFLEPLATVIQGIKRLNIKPLDKVVVVGAGTMGLLNAQVARLYGGKVIITEMMEKKINRAQKLGFQDVIDVTKKDAAKAVMELTGGRGADIVILSVGATSANEQAFQIVKESRGKILFFAAGYPDPELQVSSNLLHYKKLELMGTFGASIQDFKDAAEIISERKVNMEPLLEESFDLSEIQKAFKSASTLGNYRVTVNL